SGIDELVRLGARRRTNEIAGAYRQCFISKPILAGARYNKEQLILHMVAMKWKSPLAGRNDGDGATQRIEPEHRSNAADFGDEPLTIADIVERSIGDIDDRFLVSLAHPTLPSSETEISFCASTANSIGSCCSTSLTKPLTTRPTASSWLSPRWVQ